MPRLTTWLMLVGCLLGGFAPAAAQPTAIEKELDGAKVLYRDGQLEQAIAALRTVIAKLNELRDVQNRTRQLAEAHFHLGLAFLAMRDESSALESFRQVAALDPDRTLDPEIYSPRVMSVYERARSDIVRPVNDDRLNQPEERLEVTPKAGDPDPSAPGSTALLRVLPGTKLRVERTGQRSAVEGRLFAVNEGVLTVGADDWRVDLPRDTLTRVQVVTGRKNHWLAGMIIGTGLGVLIGALETPGCAGNDGDCYTRGENMGYGGLGLGLVGGLIGALYRTETWAEVPLERSAGGVPAGRTFALAFTWRY